MGNPIKDIVVADRWFNRLVVGAVALGFFVLLATGVAALQAVRETQRNTAWVTHTYDVERELGNFGVLVERAETGRRGYLIAEAPNALETYEQASGALMPSIARLRWLTRDNPRQQANLARLTAVTRGDLVSMAHSVDLVRDGHRDEAIALFRNTVAQKVMRSIRGITRAIEAEESRLLVLRDEAQAASLQLFYATISIAGLVLLIVGGGSIWIIARYTHDLTQSRDDLRLLNAGLEGAVRERTTDLQRANDEIQRFAYIVSHDLRSPLVNVMGFTSELESAAKQLGALIDRVERSAPDLVDPDAKVAAREDLPEAIGFIRTSTQKMDRLINAILRLSREGRRQITPEQLVMNAVMRGVVDTLHHRIAELGVEVSIADTLPDLTSDRLAIEQIFGNIIENAIKYLNPGRKGMIAVRGQAQGGRAIFEIADNGRGVDPRDHERIFDLFRRSGLQDQPGEGIGLAHTRALAYRLGGTIGIESELGRGATFRINLPIIYAGE